MFDLNTATAEEFAQVSVLKRAWLRDRRLWFLRPIELVERLA
jgi:hypothetical protein